MLNQNLFCRVLQNAQQTGTAVASINILNYNTARAVIHAAQRAYRPVILQPSVGTVKRYGVEETAAMINTLRARATVPVVLHLDHCSDEELARACVQGGWDSVMVDYSSLPFEQNVRLTRRIADYAHIYGVAVEGEIGIISGVEDDISHETACPATLEETMAYVEQTGIDAVAPSIGTAHGVYAARPELNFELIRQLGGRDVSIVIHGGTGLPKEDFQKLIGYGAVKINISTALKQIYLSASRQALDGGYAPVEVDLRVEQDCSRQMEAFIRLFAGEEVDVL